MVMQWPNSNKVAGLIFVPRVFLSGVCVLVFSLCLGWFSSGSPELDMNIRLIGSSKLSMGVCVGVCLSLCMCNPTFALRKAGIGSSTPVSLSAGEVMIENGWTMLTNCFF